MEILQILLISKANYLVRVVVSYKKLGLGSSTIVYNGAANNVGEDRNPKNCHKINNQAVNVACVLDE